MGEDCLSTIDCFRKMHVSIEILPNKVKIHGNGLYGLKPPSAPLNAGRSGTALRLLLGVLSGQPFSSVLTRNEAVLRKPVGKVVAPLRQMEQTLPEERTEISARFHPAGKTYR